MKSKDLIIGNISQLINEISQKIIQTGENSNLYTISLVKNNQLHKLPNINVSTLEQLLDFYEKYKNNPGSFDEVWYCKKQINKTASPSCVGRISFHTSDISLDISNEQILEQVWNTTHRDTYYNAYFKVTKWEGEPKINEPDKIEEIKWCNVDELPENLIDIRKNGIKNYLENIYYSEIA